MNLVDGGAFHHGVAVGRATKDWSLARIEADKIFAEDAAKSAIPPEQIYVLEEHRDLVHKMLKCFEEQYEHEVYQIIQPEVEFDVELPNSKHSCIFIHWMDEDGHHHWGEPPAELILAHKVFSPHDIRHPKHYIEPSALGAGCPCWISHRLVGKTDAVVAWNNNIWLDEYKTTSISGQQFWDQWQMDVQPTVYIYGIWRSLGIRPRGFLLNAINKPSEAQVANWNSKRKDPKTNKSIADYISYSREAFLRTEEDLKRVERLMLQTAMEWEEEVLSGSERMQARTPFQYNPGHACTLYNRKCDYYSACLAHDEPGEFAGMARRQKDYVDEKLVKLGEVK